MGHGSTLIASCPQQRQLILLEPNHRYVVWHGGCRTFLRDGVKEPVGNVGVAELYISWRWALVRLMTWSIEIVGTIVGMVGSIKANGGLVAEGHLRLPY